MKGTNKIPLLLLFVIPTGWILSGVSKPKYESSLAPESGQFFKCKMSSEIWVADCRKDSALSKMVATAIQGIINQDSAEVYLFLGDHHVRQLNDTERKYTVLNRDSMSRKCGTAIIVG